MMTETKHNHKVLLILTQTLKPLKVAYNHYRGYTWRMSKKKKHFIVWSSWRTESVCHIVPCEASFFCFFFKFPVLFLLYLHALKCYTHLLPFPWQKGQVSLIWSRRRRPDSTSQSHLVTANPSCWRTPPPSRDPPFGLDKNEWRNRKNSIGFMLGREWLRDIWPHLLLHEHTTVTS